MKIMFNQFIIFLLIVIFVIGGGFWFFSQKDESVLSNQSGAERKFLDSGLKTNTAKSSIQLEKILNGGPGKDGIPAINEPKFVSIREASSNLTDKTMGILVKFKDTVRFYPYNILVWHEIVNDRIEGEPFAVTFCPLCGSAVVFKSKINGETLRFGVSGKLYESNLLMYDRKTESLWSQILGEAVVGDMVGKKLEVYKSSILTFSEVKNLYPNSEILSEETGYLRNYDFYPYGDYEENESIYFPISVKDNRLPAKDIMYIVNINGRSVAFHLDSLSKAKKANLEVDGKKVTVEVNGPEIEVRLEDNLSTLPGYYAMWFSWAIHHQNDGIIWKG